MDAGWWREHPRWLVFSDNIISQLDCQSNGAYILLPHFVDSRLNERVFYSPIRSEQSVHACLQYLITMGAGELRSVVPLTSPRRQLPYYFSQENMDATASVMKTA